MITIVLNSRKSHNNNPGSLTGFLEKLSASLFDKNNVEVLVKLDVDDEEGLLEVFSLQQINFFGISCKFVVSDRVFYHGLHLGYEQAFKLRNESSIITVCMADDFYFRKPHWDDEILKLIKSRGFTRNDVFMSVDYMTNNLDKVPFAPMWSTKMIEICEGFGPTYSTDAWSARISKALQLTYPERVFVFDSGINRIMDSKVDGPQNKERWEKRSKMMEHIRSQEFKSTMDSQIKKLTKEIEER